MPNETAQEFSLQGRVAVVTGAASGIGQGIAQVLAQAGASIVAADIDMQGLAETARLVESAGASVVLREADVSRRADVDGLAVHGVAAFGEVDIWVNVAGVLTFVPVLEATEADLDRLIAVNLKGVFFGCAAAARVMQHRRGSIINISSAGADLPSPGLSIYAATKAAVNMLTRTAAMEFGPLGIRVNAVAPGFVETPMVTYRYRDAAGAIDAARREEVLGQRAAGSPLGLTGTPRDIGLAALYLASDASRYVTGQVLRPNGGSAMP